MERLKYFTSISVPEGFYDSFAGFETVLQQEHRVDGTHERVTSSQDGYMTAEDKQKLEQVYQWIVELRNKK